MSNQKESCHNVSSPNQNQNADEKRKYKSTFDQRQTTAQGYLLDIIFVRLAAKLKKPLPFKYWNDDEWKKDYKSQMVKANALIKVFGEENVIKAIRDNKWIVSLYVKKIPELVKQQKVTKTNLEIVEEVVMPVKTDRFAKLKDL